MRCFLFNSLKSLNVILKLLLYHYRNIGVIETKESEHDEEKSVTPDKGKDDHPTPTKGKGSKDKKDDKKDPSKDKERKRSAERKTTSKGSRRNSIVPPSPPPGQTTPVSDGDALRYTSF